MQRSNPNPKVKIAVFGNTGTGKTSLINRYCKKRFNQHQRQSDTTQSDYETCSLVQDGYTFPLEIWGVPGTSQALASFSRENIRNAQCCIIVVDLTNSHSFETVSFWVQKAKNLTYANQDSFLIVGSRSDMAKSRVVTPEDMQALATKFNCKVIETSAKDDVNVKDAFLMLTDPLIKPLVTKFQEQDRRESQATLIVSNIKNYISNPGTKFPSTWFSGSKIILDNGEKKQYQMLSPCNGKKLKRLKVKSNHFVPL